MVMSLTSSKVLLLPFGVDDLDLVALLLVEDGAPDRRRRGDHPLLGIRLFGHDQLVDDRSRRRRT
jgi:hypothetical protein